MFNYNWLIKKIESQYLMKSLIDSAFIKWLNDFWKWWFKWVFIFFWYLLIIFWLLGVLMDIRLIFRMFRFFDSNVFLELWGQFLYSSITNVLWMFYSFLAIISWIWMIKLKKWYPFMVLVTFIYKIIYIFCLNFFFARMYFDYWWWMWFRSIIIWAIFFIIWYALILKNKDLFKN